MATRYYANAPATQLSAGISAAATQLTVESNTGLPITFPYTLIIDRGQATEEVVDVTAASGTTLTVTRGVDNTLASAHSVGATVEHGISARDVREANEHINDTTGVHGLGSTDSVVGTDTAQTLTNKTISADSNTISGLPANSIVTTNASGHLDGAAAAKALPAGAVVGTTDAQTLSSKTLTSPMVDVLVPGGASWSLWPEPPTTEAGSITNYPVGVSFYRNGPALDWPGIDIPSFGAAAIITWRVRVDALAADETSFQWAFGTTWKYRQWIGGAWSSWTTIAGGTDGWTSYTPTWSSTGTSPTLGNGTLTGAYKKIGKTVHFRIKLITGTTTTYGTGVWKFSLPLAASTGGALGGVRLNHNSSNQAGSVYNEDAELSDCRVLHSSGSVSGTAPWTWDAADELFIQGTYEVP